MNCKTGRKWGSLLLTLMLLLSLLTVPMNAFAQETTFVPGTYTVTANLVIDGSENQILKGWTAYLTNSAVPPTSPVSDNATLVVGEDGSLTLTVKGLNPVV
ncbi:MAG: hypothetical protein IJ133_00295 [Clostridia bacterium]|nr:hypothetical protein [Clostridia bacterium]